MEITAEELEKLFMYHRPEKQTPGARWNLGMDPDTNWPHSVDITLNDYYLRKGVLDEKTLVIIQEHLGPEKRRRLEIPLIVLLDFWPVLQTLVLKAVPIPPDSA